MMVWLADPRRRGSVVDGCAAASYADVAVRARRMASALAQRHGVVSGSHVYLRAPDSVLSIAALGAAELLGATVCLLNPDFSPGEREEILSRLPAGPVLSEEELALLDQESGLTPKSPSPGRLMILTTGTTGVPKPVLYAWSRLWAQIPEGAAGGVWALLYPLHHFVGIQVLLHALKTDSVLAIPRSRSFPDVLNCLIDHGVDCVSASPTFWRTFTGRLTGEQASRLRLRQITLGGEAATAEILERLRRMFPKARISHVYATTELGSCFSVHDGLPGFPVSYLEGRTGNADLKIVDGELYVRTAFGMEGYAGGAPAPDGAGGWMATGDCVAVEGDRVHFLGRRSEVVNVGGVKVWPPLVEEEIRRVPGVREVRVFGKSNPVTGQIVAAEMEIDASADCEAVLAAVRAACRARLSRYEVPRDLRVVASVARRNEKLARRTP